VGAYAARRIPCLLGWIALLMLTACSSSNSAPPCPFTGQGDQAPSAGCLVVIHGKILVVESTYGGLTPPGGKTTRGEPAQCAAHRETWEETGLNLMPGELVHVFETGFHLYRCQIHAESGAVELGPLREVKSWSWLLVEDFDKVEWRYPGQGEELHRLIMAE
jgi:8-oxo-dGTP pyrophosphatase MutT (NUDIX family)